MQTPYRIGLIGCGLRGVWYLYAFKQAKVPFKLVCVADPSEHYANLASRLFANGQARVFKNGEELLDSGEPLDGVIIASPNHVHRGSTVKAMHKRLKFLLEKPVAATVEDMAAMWTAHQETRQQAIIGFVLRYAPFYKRVQEICATGVLGKILVINAEELMSDDLSVVFARGDWRPDQTKSGGLMSEKCSHDMDLLNWLSGSEAHVVHSFAQRTYLTPVRDAGERCRDCRISQTCRFVHGSVPEIYEAHWPAELREVLQKLDDDTCVFGPQHTYPDHQTLNIQYRNGVISTFTVAQCQPATRRTIHILGSEARLYGVVNDSQIKVFHRGKLGNEVVETVNVTADTSGHNGGDSVITQDFLSLLQGQQNDSRPGLREGIEASLLSLAADQSAAQGKPIYLDTLRERVFNGQPASLISSVK